MYSNFLFSINNYCLSCDACCVVLLMRTQENTRRINWKGYKWKFWCEKSKCHDSLKAVLSQSEGWQIEKDSHTHSHLWAIYTSPVNLHCMAWKLEHLEETQASTRRTCKHIKRLKVLINFKLFLVYKWTFLTEWKGQGLTKCWDILQQFQGLAGNQNHNHLY